MRLIGFILLFVAAFYFDQANALDIHKDIRYQAIVERDANGKIIRKASVIYAFKKLYPCPVTGLRTGACSGWAIDHVIPLAVGGVDAVWNMQWLPVEIKSCAGTICKDRWERKVYDRD
jgi:hypothetical protein